MLVSFFPFQSPHNVIRYSAIAGQFGNTAALEYFQISSVDGSVSVKQALTVGNRNINRYTVSMLYSSD